MNKAFWFQQGVATVAKKANFKSFGGLFTL
jgi:hypothetical protein